MNPNQTGVSAILSEQYRHQVRLVRKRMTWWIPWIFVLGLCVSILGLIPSHLLTAPDVADDIEALAAVLHAAADQGVDCSLVLRLHAKDNIQAVCTREVRQGSFW